MLQSALSAEHPPMLEVQVVPSQVSLESQHWLPWLQSPSAMAQGTQMVCVSSGPWLPRQVLLEFWQQNDWLQSPLSAAHAPFPGAQVVPPLQVSLESQH